MASEEARHLFRRALRVSHKIQSEITRRKFRFNARELVDFYSTLPAERSQPQLQAAAEILDTFGRMLNADPSLAKQLFRPFEFIDDSSAAPQKSDPHCAP